MQRAFTTVLSSLLFAAPLVAQIPMDPTGETGLGSPLSGYPWETPGADFSATGVATDSRLVGVGEPLSLDGPLLPAGCSPHEVIVKWHFHTDDQTPPATHTIQINGTPVTGAFTSFVKPGIGPFPRKAVTVGYLARFTDPNLSPVQLSASGAPAANSLVGLLNQALGSDPTAEGAGISILLVYGCAAGPQRAVVVYDGFYSTLSGSKARQALANLDFGSFAPPVERQNTYFGAGFHFFLNALGGEAGKNDDLKFGLQVVSGLVAGTNVAGDAFSGALCPTAQAPCGTYFYDHADDDVASLVAAGSAGLVLRTTQFRGGSGDDIAHSLAAVAFRVLSTPGACAVNNGNGINPVNLSVSGRPRIGQTLNLTTSVTAGVFVASQPLAAPVPGFGIFLGEFICDVSSPLSPQIAVGSTFALPIPPDITLEGLPFCVQAGEFLAPSGVQLTNALDCTFGG